MRTREWQSDVCVVGGGMSGLCAALAAARHGASVVLMHDRPVLGGNASSEIRMHISGADRSGRIPNLRETGILEELRLEDLRRNPNENFSIWDTLLYEKAAFQPGLTLLLNCTCQTATMAGSSIATLTGWQLTTETYHTVAAKIFIDCSGDGILAPLTGAEHRIGHEARGEYGESIAPEVADERTMGMTCRFHARRYDTPQPFEPPSWAYSFPTDSDLPHGAATEHPNLRMGYWWIELGGEQDSIHDTEILRDELLKIVFGIWDHLKNHGEHGAENWALDWVQFLPGKRESRRYVGDHVLTQLDIEAEGRFPDVVAYGGWSMDDHHPAGFWAFKTGNPATIFHPAPSPYGIPFRSLYSKNIGNLMFAGRCISCTHAAMSSTRVMGTCSVVGQAAGTAAAMAAEEDAAPRDIAQGRISQLQQALLRDDCYLPWVNQEFSATTASAQLSAVAGDPEPVRDGISRPIGEDKHCWQCGIGDWIAYEFGDVTQVEEVSIVLDSELEKCLMLLLEEVPNKLTEMPAALAKAFHLDGLVGGDWETVARVSGNCQRLVRVPVNRQLKGIRFVLDETWGSERSAVYAFHVDPVRVE